ncbi:binding-protein-dependent transport systems inner membrane component [Paenibacillus curdlanolyticus YK9]|uniref:Binding-protein-dependent transport systems inner membrane component n=1 Tax=Paenibacillus curdlanolyticus YK9 TaxID=717606 RepID=E0IBI0_9BACL|nr:carbohydrate ABC transporter permease [Paenibacillus curdlanolyticus]EFM10060.1 binding-protein-dependent transport systems inner membrane component [Paenibacillus curdlanolyticus YK9]
MKPSDRGILSNYDFKKTSVKIGYGIMCLLIALIIASMLYPFLNTFLNSVKSTQEFFAFPAPFFPEKWLWHNYSEALTLIPIWTFLKNTLMIFVGTVIFALLFIGMAAFALSHLNVPLKKWVTLFFLSTLMIPSATYLIPNYLNLQELGLLNTYWAFWLPAGANAFYLMLMKTFFDGIHKELFEAARIDGANEFQCFVRLAMPLSTPIVITLLIFYFSATWNDFYWPSLVMLDKEMYPLATGIYKYVVYPNSTIQWNVKFALLTLSMLPPLVFFLIFQKYITRGLNVSGVKG